MGCLMLSRFRGSGKNNTCARCETALGLRSHEPDEKYWGIEGKLCKNCYASVKSGIQEYDAYYISGYNRLPEEVEGRISVLLFDEKNEIIFTPKKKSYIPLRITANSLTDCKIINRNETTSLSRRIFTAGISKSKEINRLSHSSNDVSSSAIDSIPVIPKMNFATTANG